MEKKKMKLWKKILIVLLILFILFALLVLRNFIILSQLVESSKAYVNKTNYVAYVYSLYDNGVNMLKSYNKDGNYLTVLQVNSSDSTSERKVIIYEKGNEKLSIIQNGETKIAFLNSTINSSVQVVNSLSTLDTPMPKLLLSILSKISTDKCNGKECYLLETIDGWKMWIDKDTGLIKREINGSNVAERHYEFDIVKDDDIIKPDISDCEIQ